MDVISNGADDIVRVLDAEGTPGRTQTLAAFTTALRRFEADNSLSRNDRLGALYARVLLAQLDKPKEAVQVKLPEPLLLEVRDHVARAGPRDHGRLRTPGRDHRFRRRPAGSGGPVGRQRNPAPRAISPRATPRTT